MDVTALWIVIFVLLCYPPRLDCGYMHYVSIIDICMYFREVIFSSLRTRKENEVLQPRQRQTRQIFFSLLMLQMSSEKLLAFAIKSLEPVKNSKL